MTNREKAEQYLFHEMIEVRNNEELLQMLDEVREWLCECPCDFCAYSDDEWHDEIRCDGTDEACKRGTIEWLEDKTDDDEQ